MADMRLAEKFPMLLQLRGLKPADVARATGIDPAALSRLKEGKWTPPLDRALQIARFLGVPLDYLADDAQDEPPALRSADEEWILSAARSLGMQRTRKRLLGLPDDAPLPGGLYIEGLDLHHPPPPPPPPPPPKRKRGRNTSG